MDEQYRACRSESNMLKILPKIQAKFLPIMPFQCLHQENPAAASVWQTIVTATNR